MTVGSASAATDEQVRAEAVYRVDARHRGCIQLPPGELAAEYDREELNVRSEARQFPWDQVVSKPSPEYLARLARREVGVARIQLDLDRRETGLQAVAGLYYDPVTGRKINSERKR